MVGCRGHGNPVNPDQSSGIPRLGQAFSSPEEWGTAYSLDSSTSTWTDPCSSSLWGEIASEDGNVDPLITAFVRHDSGQTGSRIHLVLEDRSMVSVYWADFSFAVDSKLTEQGYEFCRHPAVEVTYSKAGIAGELGVHIVWAELIGEPNEQWDIIYRYLQFDPDDEEIPWEPVVDEFVNVTAEASSSHEFQPDLCVYYPEGDLYAVFLAQATVPTIRYGIYAVRLPYAHPWDPDDWELAGTVAQLNTTGKATPSIDAGYFTSVGESQQLTWQVAVVWSQLEDPEVPHVYEVFYNAWAPHASPNANYAVRISPDIQGGTYALPKIEVLPYSSGLNEAVMAWGMECAGGTCPLRINVMMAVTPFIGPGYENRVYKLDPENILHSANRCPDLAPYQGEYDAFQDKGLIAVSRQCCAISTYCDEWDIVASAYSVEVDYDENVEELYFDEEQHSAVPSNPQWDAGHPFTGPSICLRDADDEDWRYHLFGMAYVESGYTSYLVEGDTRE